MACIQQPEALRQGEEWRASGGEMNRRWEQAEGTFNNNILSAETLHMSALQKFPYYYSSPPRASNMHLI